MAELHDMRIQDLIAMFVTIRGDFSRSEHTGYCCHSLFGDPRCAGGAQGRMVP